MTNPNNATADWERWIDEEYEDAIAERDRLRLCDDEAPRAPRYPPEFDLDQLELRIGPAEFAAAAARYEQRHDPEVAR